MRITSLEIDFHENGKATASLSLRCVTQRDIAAIRDWLGIASNAFKEWERICAEASRPAQTPPSENENSEPREIQGSASTEGGANGLGSLKEAAELK